MTLLMMMIDDYDDDDANEEMSIRLEKRDLQLGRLLDAKDKNSFGFRKGIVGILSKIDRIVEYNSVV